MIVSPNEIATTGIETGSALNFFTVTTSADLTQAVNINAMMECISVNGQPVISSLTQAGTDPVISTLQFAIEHTGAWPIVNTDGVLTCPTLLAAIVAEQLDAVDVTNYPYVYSSTTPFTDATVTVNTL
jgi:hypothetical protein